VKNKARGVEEGITVCPGLQFDEEGSRRVEATYRTPDVIAQRRVVLKVLGLCPGERVLDIGSGPGFLASEMGEAVGPAGRVYGIDLSESMIKIARERCADRPWVEFQPGDARRLPFPDHHFDVAVSTQVYEYVNDMAAALSELYRVLRPGGRALILDTDWDSIVWHTADRTLMDQILAAWSEHCADPYLPRTLGLRLRRGGFQLRHQGIIPLFNPRYDPNTYSYELIKVIRKFVPGRRGITEEKAEAWAEDLRKLGEEGAYFFSLNRYFFLVVKPGTDPVS